MHSNFLSFTDPATTEIYTLSLHDALPISRCPSGSWSPAACRARPSPASASARRRSTPADRKSTRLNSSHLVISYAVFCLKKKKNLEYHNVLITPIDTKHLYTAYSCNPLKH